MFYSFDVSRDRARTNCLPCALPLSHFDGTKAAAALRKLRPQLGPGALVHPALNTMAMGDLNAVDFAQESHGALLAGAGAWPPGCRVLGAEPLPEGRHLELLTVDDHVGVARVPKGAPEGMACQPLAPEVFSSFAKARD
eukprot:2737214-Lingulodinium_polyedra.AAC.1